jgi:histidinol-phosphate aminotransferase
VELDRPGIEVYEALLREGVIVRPVANYQLPNHLRVTVGTESDNARLLEAMKKVLGR